MKKKTTSLNYFIEGLHEFIVNHPQFRKDTCSKSEGQIQTEIRPLIIQYLETHFKEKGYKDYTAKANQSFYWEGQEGKFGRNRASTFGSKSYPDFIITDPYLIAIEYKKNLSGSLVKHGIGQSIIHTMCGDFDFVYFLFHDENNDERIKKASGEDLEKEIIGKLWKKFNVYIKFV